MQSESKKSGMGARGLVIREPLIFEKSVKGRIGFSLDCKEFCDYDRNYFPDELRREELKDFPELSEVDVVRHFTRLSQYNFGVDTSMYPLGSCTMKYNPKLNEKIARLAGFANLHPYAPPHLAQGALQIIYELERYISEISGFKAVTLQPAAGAQGEFAGLMMIRAALKARGKPRKKVIVPDTAHGTNPASSALNGYGVIGVKSSKDGFLKVSDVAEVMDDDVAAIMLTNPNTLGIFEEEIGKIADVVHKRGGFVYCDGANLNALMGIARPGEMGVDVMQFNLHKTFSTPHGGGGPGSGPVGVTAELEPYLPLPRVFKEGSKYYLDYNIPTSIGRVKAFYGHFGVILRAYTYIRELGAGGLKKATEMAVLNANYLKALMRDTYFLPKDYPSLHEVVFSDKNLEETGVTTMDVAKRLMDYGFHPPTVYFPLTVHGAIMIEPTESESPETIEAFVGALKEIAREAKENPELVKSAPNNPYLRRLDEVSAAKSPCLTWSCEMAEGEG
ncbi:MAG: aminomethyl-transferring glycine dehydrogenase subunit GcvPB [Myxococcota bacterium]